MKRLVLLGGGHAHVFVLDAWARQPVDGVEVTLITPYRRQVYSGMLPGWIAGHYPLDACMIPLDALARRCGCQFRHGVGVHIDTEQKRILCADGSTVEYDVLSIDIGSTTALEGIAGAIEHSPPSPPAGEEPGERGARMAEEPSPTTTVLPVRPIENFILGWEKLLDTAKGKGAISLALLGGGAAGVELALAMQYRLHREIGGEQLDLHLVSASPRLLPDHPQGVGACLARLLEQRRVTIHAGHRAKAITSEGISLANGEFIAAGQVIIATGASAPAWLRNTGIALDAEGFIQTDQHLRSTSHPAIFAAGDTASMVGQPRPKSGVYAVRAGPPLVENLRRSLQNQPLLIHRPQRRALYLMNTGDEYAVGSWGPFSWEGAWVWRWKDRIDRKFMSRFQHNETQG